MRNAVLLQIIFVADVDLMQKLTEVHLQRDCSIATELLHYLTKGKLPHDFFSGHILSWFSSNLISNVDIKIMD